MSVEDKMAKNVPVPEIEAGRGLYGLFFLTNSIPTPVVTALSFTYKVSVALSTHC